MNSRLKKLFVGITLTGYILLAVFSLALIPRHMHTDMPSGPCPYSSGTHAVCSMDLLEHMDAWAKAIQTLMPYVTVLCIILWSFSIKALTGNVLPKLRYRRPERQYSPYVTLFSTGILNPKVP